MSNRGFPRLGASLWLLWFVYWTCAYALQPHQSENHPPPLPLLTYVVLGPLLIAAAAFGVRWVIAGFRASRHY